MRGKRKEREGKYTCKTRGQGKRSGGNKEKERRGNDPDTVKWVAARGGKNDKHG